MLVKGKISDGGQGSLAKELEGARGLMNIQFAVKDDDLYVIEVNPSASSRTVPFRQQRPSECRSPKLAAKDHGRRGETGRTSDLPEPVFPDSLLR